MVEISKKSLTILIFFVVLLSLFSTYILFNQVAALNSKVKALETQVQLQPSVPQGSGVPPVSMASGVVTAEVASK